MTIHTPTKTTIITKGELIHQVAARSGQPLSEIGVSIDALTATIYDNLAQGNSVSLMGFGTWSLREIAPRHVKSIRGGDSITIPATRRVGFKTGAVLARAAQQLPAKGRKKRKTASGTPKDN